MELFIKYYSLLPQYLKPIAYNLLPKQGMRWQGSIKDNLNKGRHPKFKELARKGQSMNKQWWTISLHTCLDWSSLSQNVPQLVALGLSPTSQIGTCIVEPMVDPSEPNNK